MTDNIYMNGEYLKNNQNWHAEDSGWKVLQITKMLQRHLWTPGSIGEVGCGVGEVLLQLSKQYPEADCEGYDLSPQAIEIATAKASAHLRFYNGDIAKSTSRYDLLIAMDVLEHVESSFEFLRQLRPLAKEKLFHVPLDFNALSVLRGWPVMEARNKVGHIHYYFKDTALAMFTDCGYEIVDFFYTASALESEGASKSVQAQIMNVVRKCLFRFMPDLTVRAMGGYSLLVWAR